MLHGSWGDPHRSGKRNCTKYKDRHNTGDVATTDKDTYIMLMSRMTDIMSSSGHPRSTMPVVSAWATETVRSPGTLPRNGPPNSPMVRPHSVVFPSEFQRRLLRLRYGIGVAPTAAPRHTEATQWTSGSGWRRT